MMVIPVLLFILLGLTALLSGANALMIRWHFSAGKTWVFIPLKMIFPATVGPMTILSLLSGGCSLLLAISMRDSAGLLFAGLAVTAISITAGIAQAGYIFSVTRSHNGFAEAFGPDWPVKLAPIGGMLERRWSPIRYPDRPVRLERDVVIWTFQESGKHLLADVWQPAEGTKPTGVALLFFHGSAWHFFDKGIGTDPMFRHLASQGNVIIDVAYRLAPEVDIAGMTADVKRAVIWAKRNADRLGIDPERVVVCGASAGGHISLLSAYGHTHSAFTHPDLEGLDASVGGVISLYAPSDFRAYLAHHAGRMTLTGKPVTESAPVRFDGMSGEQMMMNLCGGMPEDAPGMFDLADVRTHISQNGPPALIFQGEVDFITPRSGTLQLVECLRRAAIPVIYVEFRGTEHAWDIGTAMADSFFPKGMLPRFLNSQYAPPTRAMIYDIERFLALIASDNPKTKANDNANAVA